MDIMPQSKAERENFTIRMKPKLKKALKIQAIEENRDPSDLIEDAVLRYLQTLEPPARPIPADNPIKKTSLQNRDSIQVTATPA